jgi:hypothetical protein
MALGDRVSRREGALFHTFVRMFLFHVCVCGILSVLRDVSCTQSLSAARFIDASSAGCV